MGTMASTAALIQESELKFQVSGPLASAAAGWLRSAACPHPEYPEGTISSVYYDTADWSLLDEKVHSDYFKTKVRLRWYEGGNSPAFVEAKFKTGSQRSKIRLPLSGSAEDWTSRPLDDALYAEPLELLREHGVAIGQNLFPAFQITYRRQRFTHPFSACVVCVDDEIRSPRVHPGRFRHAHPGPLAFAVLEQKGHLDRLDPVFDGLLRYGIRKTAFSKYLNCYTHLTGTFL